MSEARVNNLDWRRYAWLLPAVSCAVYLLVSLAHHQAFHPWRIQALALKAIRRLYPDYPLWRDFPYEYERDRLAIDLINGSELLRQWVDDQGAVPADLDVLADRDEAAWREEREAVLLYR